MRESLFAKLRSGTFWDTTLDEMDQKQNAVAVVKHVFSKESERGKIIHLVEKNAE